MEEGNAGIGMLAYNCQGQIIHAWTEARESIRSSVALVWEAVRFAQLKAYQQGWNHMIFQVDVEGMAGKLGRPNQPVEIATIAEDINLLTFIFEEVSYHYIHRLQNLGCHRLALYALEFSRSDSWNSSFPSWLLLKRDENQALKTRFRE